MAKQNGVVNLEGTIGNITFFKSGNNYLARMHSPVSANRIATDPAFQRTRENMSEFGRAGKGAKLLRNALRIVLQQAKDGSISNRLTKQMMFVLKADTINRRGKRNVIDGEAELLQGFEFNSAAPLSTTFKGAFTASIDRTTGEALVNIPSFIPQQMVTAPIGATHFRMITAAVAVDFEKEVYDLQSAESPYLLLDNNDTTSLSLSNRLPANSTHPLFLVLGIEFVQHVNGINYSLNTGSFNSVSLVKVSGS